MARYKGQYGALRNERNFPHIVQIIVPPGGLGKRLDAMYDFHSRHGIQAKRGQGQYTKGRNFIRWCFADLETAAAFAAEFKPASKECPASFDDNTAA
jgi:hypothetical protein